jgi:hypothetical protein
LKSKQAARPSKNQQDSDWLKERFSAAAALLRDDSQVADHLQAPVTSRADVRALQHLIEHLLSRDHVGRPAVVRTLDLWFGYQWDAVSERLVRGVLQRTLDFLKDPAARHDALASADAETAYLALWATACFDVEEATDRAADLLDSANVERRFVAVHLLDQLSAPRARRYLAEAIDDDDLRVALRALEGCQAPEGATVEEIGLFERLERLLPRLPEKKQALAPLVWPWQVLMADRADVAVELEETCGSRSVTRLLPYLPWLSKDARVRLIQRLLKRRRLTEFETLALEGILHTGDESFRDGFIQVLASQPDRDVIDSLSRLLGAALYRRRLAGLKLVETMLSQSRLAPACRELLGAYRQSHRHLKPDEEKIATALLQRVPKASTSRGTAGKKKQSRTRR